jgi:D-xylose transport system substrate-binding protein
MNKIFTAAQSISLIGLLFLTACVNNLANNISNTPTSNQPNSAADIQATDKFSAASGCKNIGVLLPETDSSPRYEAFDRPLLQQEIKK